MPIIAEEPFLFFMKELEEALARERVRVSDEARIYVSGLLSRLQSETGPMRHEPLTPDYLAGIATLDDAKREALLRAVGDSALVICGWWWQWLDQLRRPKDSRFHAELGRRAYQHIDEQLFDELANKFSGLIDVLARMSARLQTDDRQLMDSYRIWLRTQNRHAERLLRLHGIDVRAAERQKH